MKLTVEEAKKCTGMNYKDIKRQAELLESNLRYIDQLNKAINSESMLTLTYKIKNVVNPGELDVREGWGFLEDEFKQSLRKEIERTNEANEGIAERLGTDLETLLKDTEYAE